MIIVTACALLLSGFVLGYSVAVAQQVRAHNDEAKRSLERIERLIEDYQHGN